MSLSPLPNDDSSNTLRRAYRAGLIAIAIAPLNFLVWMASVTMPDFGDSLMGLFGLLAVLQTVLGVYALIGGIRARLKLNRDEVAAEVRLISAVG